MYACMHDLGPIFYMCFVWLILVGMLVDIVFAWLIVEKCETSKIKEWTNIPYQKASYTII